MAKIALLTELTENEPKSVTLEILGKLSGHQVEVLGIGDLSPAAEQLKKYGASKIVSITGTEVYSPEGYSSLLVPVVKEGSFDYLLAGATSLAKDLLPRVGGMLGVGMASEVTELAMEGDQVKATRPLFAGKVLADVKVMGPKPPYLHRPPQCPRPPRHPFPRCRRDQNPRGQPGRNPRHG